MTINPEVGTAPRPDVSGVGKYDNAGEQLGINRTSAKVYQPDSTKPDYYVEQLTNVTVNWDFPETKFVPDTTYQVEVSFHSDFQDDEAAVDRLETGIAGVPAIGTFTLDFSEFVSAGTGTPTVELVDKPWATIFVRIRALGQGTWSETLMTTLRPPQNVPALT